MSKNQAKTPKIILLFGMPRSGTTWLGKTFDSHPATEYLHEPDSRTPSLDIPLLPLTDDYERLSEAVCGYLSDLMKNNSISVIGKLPLFQKSYFAPGEKEVVSLFVYGAKVVSRFGWEISLPSSLGKNRRTTRTIVWKSIESIGRLPVFSRQLAESSAIHILRHPCGYVDSVVRGESKGHFGSTVNSGDDIGFLQLLVDSEPGKKHGLTLDYLQSLTAIERLAWRWVVMNEKAYIELGNSENYMLMNYERLCEDPIEQYKILFEFCHLPWHSQCADFLSNTSKNKDGGYYSVNRDPKVAANAWKKTLDNSARESIELIVKKSSLAEVCGI